MKRLDRPWCSFEPLGQNYSGRCGLSVDAIVLHYTTAGYYQNTLRWFNHPDCHSSAHFVVGRKGQIVQLVPLDAKAWHAGDGEMDHRGEMTGDPNRFSVGIEMANHGLLEQKTGGSFATDWGLPYSRLHFGDPKHAALKYYDGSIVSGYWEPYSQLQIGAMSVLCQALINEFSIPLSRIVGHQDTALPLGRKKDPGPLWPWDDFLGRLSGAAVDRGTYRRTEP